MLDGMPVDRAIARRRAQRTWRWLGHAVVIGRITSGSKEKRDSKFAPPNKQNVTHSKQFVTFQPAYGHNKTIILATHDEPEI
jgi:hypothetical protein